MGEQQFSEKRIEESKPAVMKPAENPANFLHVVCTVDDLKNALESLIKGWNDYEFTIEWRLKDNG